MREEMVHTIRRRWRSRAAKHTHYALRGGRCARAPPHSALEMPLLAFPARFLWLSASRRAHTALTKALVDAEPPTSRVLVPLSMLRARARWERGGTSGEGVRGGE